MNEDEIVSAIGGKEEKYFSEDDGEWHWALTEMWLEDGTIIKLKDTND